MSSSKLIDVHGITKTFRSKFLLRPHTALAGLDLEVEEGEIFGFLGPNGAGKTTTIKILLGLIRPTSGTGTVLGRRFGSVDARRDTGFLPDAPNFYRYLTARELLTFAGNLHGMSGDALGRRVEEVLDRVGLPGAARGRQLRTYSRGMLQRTGIAAAVLPRPRLVILDEPMNGLDPIGRSDFRDLVLSLKSEGVTVFLSSHVLGDIESTADRVGILNGGKLVRCGALAEILSSDERCVEIAFELENGAGETLEEIGRRLIGLRPHSRGWIGEAPGTEQATHIVESVLRAGGKLISYAPRRVSLEEFFVQQVSESASRILPPIRPAESAAPARAARQRQGIRT